MLSSLLFTAVCNADISIEAESGRKQGYINPREKKEKGYIYTDGEDIHGSAFVNVKQGKKLEHQGIKVELIGYIDMVYDKANSFEFFSMTRELEPAGVMTQSKNYRWKFANVDKPYETYWGNNIKLRYFVRLSILRTYASNITKEVDFLVHSVQCLPDINNPIKMEVGIEDCLHIEFEYDRSKFHLKDVVIGKVYFLLVRIRIKHMELDIVRKEICGSGSTATTDSETVTKFEVMDGAPVKNETIPVRLYLGGFDLSPTMKNIQNKFSVKYFLNIVLVDEEDRRYFKQQEIFLWRESL